MVGLVLLLASLALVQSDGGQMVGAREAAKILGLSERSIYALAAPAGPIPCYRHGRAVRFLIGDVLQYREKCRVLPAARTAAGGKPSLSAVTLDLEACFLAAGVKLRRIDSSFLLPRRSCCLI